MQKISPFLWFDSNAEEAVNFYVSIFKDSKIKDVSRYGDAGPGPKGQVMVMNFEIEGQDFPPSGPRKLQCNRPPITDSGPRSLLKAG